MAAMYPEPEEHEWAVEVSTGELSVYKAGKWHVCGGAGKWC